MNVMAGFPAQHSKKQAHWGKVETTYEQMVFSEATIAFPLITAYGYHTRAWEGRPERRFNDF
jgi:deoxyhypusine synthase